MTVRNRDCCCLLDHSPLGSGADDGTQERLLPRQRQRELPLRTRRQPLDELRHRLFAIGADQFGQRGEQARLREAVAVDAVMARLGPGLVQIGERGLLLLVVGQGSRAIGRTLECA